MYVNAPTTVCWLIINIVPYHHARALALAAHLPMQVSLIQLTDVDMVKASPGGTGDAVPYRSETLFPGIPWSGIDQGDLSSRLYERLDALKPGVVCLNGWSEGGSATALRWCLANRVPAIVFSDSAAIDMPRVPWREWVKRRIVNLCSAALVAGTPHAEYLSDLRFPEDRIFLGYDVVDNRHFEAGADMARQRGTVLRQILGLPERYFLASARFVEKKNLSGLLHAYAAYRQATPRDPWSLVVLGDGELRPELERLRERTGARRCGVVSRIPVLTGSCRSTTAWRPVSFTPARPNSGGLSSTRRWRPVFRSLCRTVAAAPSTLFRRAGFRKTGFRKRERIHFRPDEAR